MSKAAVLTVCAVDGEASLSAISAGIRANSPPLMPFNPMLLIVWPPEFFVLFPYGKIMWCWSLMDNSGARPLFVFDTSA